MRNILTLFSTISIIMLAASVLAQTPRIKAAKLTDKIYELTADYAGQGVNMLAMVGPDGVLLVDTGPKETAEELKQLVATLGNGEVKKIINTHAHKEHTGGNIAFGNDVVKIAHESVPARLQQGTYILDEFPPEVLPNKTFTDSLTFNFNGEEIRLIAIPGAHDDGDIIVHFTQSGVVAAGALCSGMHFPTIDGIGGNALKFPDAVQKLIDLVPDDVILVPGHGRNCTIAEEKEYQNMLTETVVAVTAGLIAGKDMAALQKDSVLKEWASYEGGFTNMDQWIQMIANSYNGIKPKPSSAVELYYAYKAHGIDSAIAEWYRLKKSHPDSYNFGEGQLTGFGYYLLGKGKIKDAIRVFELYVKEFPDAWNAYDCLAEAYMNDGNKELSRKYYQKSLELNPQNTNAVEMMKKL